MAKKLAGEEEIDDLFDDENIPESSWFKMEKIGDRVGGEVVGINEQPAKDDFAAQRVFSLKQKDGTIIKYGVKYPKIEGGKMKGSDYLINRTASVNVGDKLGFELKKLIPPKVKGHHHAKSIECYIVKGKKPVDALNAFSQ